MTRTNALTESVDAGTARKARRAGLGSVLLATAVLMVAGCGSGNTKHVGPGSGGGGQGTTPPTTSHSGYGY